MKTDLYTKIVLTVIAVCLVIMVVGRTNFINMANAGSGDPVPVIIRALTKPAI